MEEKIFLICKCGVDKFHVATNGKFAMCSKCHSIYNYKGELVTLKEIEGGTKVKIDTLGVK